MPVIPALQNIGDDEGQILQRDGRLGVGDLNDLVQDLFLVFF